jgi:hypothetical protein
MTERKPGLLSIFRRPDAGNVPAPWVPPEPAAPGAGGRTKSPLAPWVPAQLPASAGEPAAAKNNRRKSPPIAWVPAELPASNAAPAALASDRKIAKRKPWVPPPEAPRDLPADGDRNGTKTPELQPGERRPAEPAVTQNTGPAIQQTIIVQQVAAPAQVYVAYGCPRLDCARYSGRMCWRVFCWWW